MGMSKSMQRFVLSVVFVVFLLGSMAESVTASEKMDRKVRADRSKFLKHGFWLYNDIDQAYRQAKKSGKPILVSFRCVPCTECVKIDEAVIESDARLAFLFPQFVCVRVVGTNGLDLNTFQFDTDQSFSMFMLNADKTIYGRYGTRSDRTEWKDDVSVDGLVEALEGALELHKNYPANRELFAGKTRDPWEFRTPERYPYIKKPNRLDYAGKVSKSCIHCHEVGEARRDFYREKSKPVPARLMYPYPHPKSIGLILDPKTRATVKRVISTSPAARAGLKKGDRIEFLGGQPLLSMADVQWVLHYVPFEGAELPMKVRRGTAEKSLSLKLSKGWRERGDTSWRVSTWIFRRALGGMKLDALSASARKKLGIRGEMALQVVYLGDWQSFGIARKQGLKKGDVIVEFDGRSDFPRESDVIDHVNIRRKAGDVVGVVLLRNGKTLRKKLPLQR
ncbi:MAG: Trx7/PDZ domain-containing (seleno)protein [Planctomycetota bacterium]